MHLLMARAVDTTLDPADHDLLSAHVAQCDGCRRTLAAQRAVKQALADLPMASVSVDFAFRVRERVSARWIDAFDWRVWTLRLAPVAALLALLTVLPFDRSTSSTETASADTAQSLSGSLDSNMQLLLNPDSDAHALLEAALEETTR